MAKFSGPLIADAIRFITIPHSTVTTYNSPKRDYRIYSPCEDGLSSSRNSIITTNPTDCREENAITANPREYYQRKIGGNINQSSSLTADHYDKSQSQSVDLEAKIFQNFRTKPKHHHKPPYGVGDTIIGDNLNIIGGGGGGDSISTTTPTNNNQNVSNTNFSNTFGKNFAKIRQHEASDISPRPRRPYQNDSSASRYYTKNSSDVIGQGRYIIDRDQQQVQQQQQQQQHQTRQRYNNYQQQQPSGAPSGGVGGSGSSTGSSNGNGLVDTNNKESTNNYYNKNQGTGVYNNSRNNGRTYENGGSSYNRRDHQYQQYESNSRYTNGYSNNDSSGGPTGRSSPSLNGGGGRSNHNSNHQQQRYTNNYNNSSHSNNASNGSNARNSSVERAPRFEQSREGAADSRGYHQYQHSRGDGLSNRYNNQQQHHRSSPPLPPSRSPQLHGNESSLSSSSKFVSNSDPNTTTSSSTSSSPAPTTAAWIPPSLRPQHILNQQDRQDAVFRKVRGILNKLTPEKFQELSDDLLKLDLNSEAILNGVIKLIFEKALDEPKYSSMYAQLCKRLSKEAPNFEESTSKNCTFLNCLLNVCRDKFENRSTTKNIVLEFTEDGSLTPDSEEKLHIAKQRMLGNVKFIGELSKLHMLQYNTLHLCIQELLERSSPNSTIQDRCEDMECLSQLIKTCGKDLDTEQGKKLMDQYFEKMERRSKSNKFPPRIRFLLKDVIELRENNWIPRKIGGIQTEGPVPIRQIRSQDEDNLVRTPFANNRRDTRGDRENDNWMNRFPSNLQSGGYDILSSLSVASPSNIMSPNFNNTNRPYNNQRNNQNYNNMNGNNRYNKHNSPANGQSYNNNQYNNSNNQSTPFSGNNNLMAPRFKKNLITATQEAVENLQMRPQANSLLFKAANHNNKTPTLPISQQTNNSTPVMNAANYPLISTPTAHQRPSSTPSAEFPTSANSASKLSLESERQDLHFKSTSSSPNLMSTGSLGTPKLNLKTDKPSDSPATPAQSVSNGNQKAASKQGKKEKGPGKEESIKRCVQLVSDALKAVEFDLEDTHNNFQDIKVPEKHMKDVTIAILNDHLDDPQEKSCERLIELLKKLRQSKKLAENALIEAFRQIINKIGEKEAAIPKIKTHIANLQSKAVQNGLTKLSDVANFAENGQNHPLILLILQQLHKSMGQEDLEVAFKASRIDIMKCLPEGDRNKVRLADILEDRGLSFLYPMLKVQSEMMKEIQQSDSPTSFYKWIKANIDSKYYTESGFVTALMSVLLKYITAGSTLTEDTDIKKYPERSVIEKEEAILHKYCQILVTFLNGNIQLQLVAIYALQVFCYQASFPKGMLCRWFKNLYEEGVIEEETFLRWKEELTDENEYPGKGSSLFQVNQWLTWLEEAESEEEDDDDEKKDKATEK